MISSLADISPILIPLGLGDAAADRPLAEIIQAARERVLELKRRAEGMAAPAPVLPTPTWLRDEHDSQYVAVDLEGAVHIHGPWVGQGGDAEAVEESRIRGEMLGLQAAGIDLVLVKYWRCKRLNLTTLAPGGEEVDNNSISPYDDLQSGRTG